jgi:cysteine desulfurase
MENKMKYLLLSGLVITSLVVAKDNLQNSTYLDYAASAHINSESLKKFIEISKLDGNSSGFNPHAQKLKQIENESAKTIAKKIGCNSDQILFTNSATISNNVAILGVAYKNPGCHLITSKIEHKSVLNVFKYLEKSGYRVTYIGVDRYGNLDLEELKKSIRPTTRLVSIQSFNSEIGTRQDVAAISKIIKNSESKDILFHSDISQAFGKYPTDFSVFEDRSAERNRCFVRKRSQKNRPDCLRIR